MNSLKSRRQRRFQMCIRDSCYSNASSFIRAFKRICEMTPGEYREKVKKEKET